MVDLPVVDVARPNERHFFCGIFPLFGFAFLAFLGLKKSITLERIFLFCMHKSVKFLNEFILKAKVGPGKLSFNKLGNFEKSTEVDCVICKKKISEGQRFLTHKTGN